MENRSNSAWPPPVHSPRPLCQPLCCPLGGEPHTCPGEGEDRWDYQNWGGLRHSDLHVGFLAEHPESSWPPCQGPGWCAGHSPTGAGHHCTGACRVYGVKGLYLYRTLGNKTSGYISLNIVCVFIEKGHRNRCLWHRGKLAFRAVLMVNLCSPQQVQSVEQKKGHLQPRSPGHHLPPKALGLLAQPPGPGGWAA